MQIKPVVLFIDIGGDLHTHDVPKRVKNFFPESLVGAITSTKIGFVNDFDFFVDYDAVMTYKVSSFDRPLGISNDLYQLVKGCEVDALRMMDRLPQFEHGYAGNLGDRRELFFELSKFLHQFLANNKITHVIFGNIPHEVYDFILYELCKSIGIPTLIFNDVGGVIKNSLTICESIESLGNLSFGRTLKENIGLNQNQSWESQVVNDFYRKQQISRPHSRKFQFIHRKIAERIPLTRKRWRLLVSKHEYQRYVKKTLPSEKYLLLALHVQPELSTSPCGGHYVEQLEAIKLLAEYFEDCKILVREHPDQFRLRIPRPKNFYESIIKIPGVSLSSSSISINDVVANATAVATVSGTIALEAVLLGKPGLIFGHSWFKECPGIYNISEISGIEFAKKEIERWTPPTEFNLSEYVDRLTSSIFQGNTWGSPIELSESESEEFRNISVSNISNIIIHWISLGSVSNHLQSLSN